MIANGSVMMHDSILPEIHSCWLCDVTREVCYDVSKVISDPVKIFRNVVLS